MRSKTVDQNAKGFLPVARAFLAEFQRYAGARAWGAGLLIAAGAVVESLGIVLLIPLLGVVLSANRGSGRLHDASQWLFRTAGVQSAMGELGLLLGMFCALTLVRAIVVTWRDIALAELQIGFLEDQRTSVMHALAGARWAELARLRHARITQVIGGDLQRIGGAAHFLLQNSVSAVVLVSQCALAFLLSPALALVAFGLLAIIGAMLIPITRRARALGEFVTRANLVLLDAATQFMGGLKLAISQNLQSRFVTEFQQTVHLLTRKQIASVRERTLGRVGLTMISALVGAALVLLGFGVFHISAPILIAVLLIIARMEGPAGQIQQGLQQLAHALPAFEQVQDLRDELVAAREPAEPSAPFPRGDLVFADVTLRHDPDSADETPRGVEGVDFHLSEGEFVGIAGPSGAGKTTFADLMAGLLPPQSGHITVGGKPLQGSVLAGWRSGMSYVSQDPFLFHDSVRRNLSWAAPDASEAEMWDALTLTGVEALVRRMPEGLDTVVGERGMLVSGGERQRIALARAILRRPRLLVLDEATNAIDVATEHKILERLRGLVPRPTVVMIAHRPESLALCERMLRMEAGRLSSSTMAGCSAEPRERSASEL